MPFPTLSSLLAYHHVFLISGPVAIAGGLFLLKTMRARRGQRLPFTLMLGPPIAFFIGAYHIWNTGVQLSNAFLFRSLTVANISALEITPMVRSASHDHGGGSLSVGEQMGQSAPPIRIDDPALIREAFELIEPATAISRSTAPLVSGYLVKLMTTPTTDAPRGADQKPEFYLSIYDHRDGSGEPTNILVPHVGLNITPSSHGGYFASPGFMGWVAAHAK